MILKFTIFYSNLPNVCVYKLRSVYVCGRVVLADLLMFSFPQNSIK